MQATVRQVLSFFLLATFLFAAAPQELIHLFGGHEDTVDTRHSDLQFSTAHKHCCTLQLSLPLFIGSAEVSLPSALFENTVIDNRVISRCVFSAPNSSLDRGPPMIA